MIHNGRPRPLKEAARITQMLDIVFGIDRFDRHAVDVKQLALQYSAQIDPKSPIHEIRERNLEGCVGALVYSEEKPRQWGILYRQGQSPGRQAFTIGHEFGHYVLHRQLIEDDGAYDGGIFCDENSVLRRNGAGIEKEADEFAAALLMPLHDFRRQLPSKQRCNFIILSHLAQRYGVSLTAVILRWLEYTETRALMVVSNEGFAHWAKSSESAFKSGRYLKTRDTVVSLPEQAFAVRRDFSDVAKDGTMRATDIWFSEPVHEMCLRSDRYDQEITLLQFETEDLQDHSEEHSPDTLDQFLKSGQTS